MLRKSAALRYSLFFCFFVFFSLLPLRPVITSSSNRDYTITSPDGAVQTRSYQWRQTITFQSCPHDEATMEAPSTQQLSVDQIFVMFDADNHLIRYAMSNKIGSVHSEFKHLRRLKKERQVYKTTKSLIQSDQNFDLR